MYTIQMSTETANWMRLDSPQIELHSLGKVGSYIGSGLHTDVYEFSPYSSAPFSSNQEWVAKLPTHNLCKLQSVKFINYPYVQELRESQEILKTAQQNGIAIPFSEMHFVGDTSMPAIIQKRSHGGHPTLYDPNFPEVFAQVLKWNVQLKEQFDAEFDLFHFAKNIFKHGFSKNIPLDGFMYQNPGDAMPTLVDCQLNKIYESDPPYTKRFKESLRRFTKTVIETAWEL